MSELTLERRTPLERDDDPPVTCRPLPVLAGESLIDQLLRDQQQLSAVEEFARQCDAGGVPDQARYYSRLLPASPPGPGQQYAFDVDLDCCSGCKACVTACHALNGLDETETWRDVGLLIGGTEHRPVMQHVTAACHHCLEPACMSACPVDAYEKDFVTGIVKHLDDQCFGCQYCTLACPYDVPKYQPSKGIVRKCDMCSQRLAEGEAPACVQACPHEAISIRVVDVARVIENAEADNFLPAAPEPHLTLPTTTYRTQRVFPRNMLPADYYSISPQHPHWPLIVMLVLTQLSVGAFITGVLVEGELPVDLGHLVRPWQSTSSLVLGLLALAASTLHLGRPQFAFRGLIGLRHSWLSREILAFGLFAALAVPYAAVSWWVAALPATDGVWHPVLSRAATTLGVLVSVVGGLGLFCSAMIYVFTRRELWSLERTTVRFALTAAVLGIATTWLSCAAAATFLPELARTSLATATFHPLAAALAWTSAAKIAFDALVLRHLATFRNTPLKRTACLVTGVLAPYSLLRIAAGGVGGVLIPLLVLSQPPLSAEGGLASVVTAGLAWLGCLCGELCERYLFFAAVSSPRMPGGVRP